MYSVKQINLFLEDVYVDKSKCSSSISIAEFKNTNKKIEHKGKLL